MRIIPSIGREARQVADEGTLSSLVHMPIGRPSTSNCSGLQPLPDRPSPERGAEQSDREPEEGSHQDIPEVMGRHHDAA